MGWFSFGGSSAPADDGNPTADLDPSLKKFLDEQSPKPYTTTAPTGGTDNNVDINAPASIFGQPKNDTAGGSASVGNDEGSGVGVPQASLFSDGRYAHLWKTYKPLYSNQQQQHKTALDQQTTTTTIASPSLPSESPSQATSEPSNAERVIDHFKRRKESLNDAALENCAEEHEALTLCFKTGGLGDKIWSRVTLCKAENEQFSRCYTMQSKFLQALGYASTFAPDSDREERIQMHADKLYHKMLDYERAAEEAHAKNEPVPEPVSLFKSRQQTETTPATPVSAQDDGGDHSIPVPGGETLPPGAHWSKAPERLTPHEREVEVRIARQQMEMRHQYRGEVEDVLKEEEMAKRLRQEKFSKWFGPTVGKWLA